MECLTLTSVRGEEDSNCDPETEVEDTETSSVTNANTHSARVCEWSCKTASHEEGEEGSMICIQQWRAAVKKRLRELLTCPFFLICQLVLFWDSVSIYLFVVYQAQAQLQ